MQIGARSAAVASFVVRKPIHRSTIPGRLHAVNRGCGAASIAVRISFVLKYIIIRLARKLNKWCGQMRLDRIGVIKFIRADSSAIHAIGIGRWL